MPIDDESQALQSLSSLSHCSDWDVAIRYTGLKKATIEQKQSCNRVRAHALRGILNEAKRQVGKLTHPVEPQVVPFDLASEELKMQEIDWEETFENAPHFEALTELWVHSKRRRKNCIILCIDTSLSMTGEKLALTAVALGVVLLQFPSQEVGIVTFENQAHVLKAPGESRDLTQIIGKFLDTPSGGYTYLETGIREVLKMIDGIMKTKGSQQISTVLMTDGKYTAGKNPVYLGSRFQALHVVKIGDEQAGRDVCIGLAKTGRGHYREVHQLKELPQVMVRLVKDLLHAPGRALT